MTEMQLRDGSLTLDPKLDLCFQKDERSRDYPVSRFATVAPPVTTLWEPGPVTDQGQEGACVGHGWTGELTADPVPLRIEGDLNAFATKLYHYCQFIDEWPGEAYSGTSVLAGAKALQSKGLIQGYAWAFSKAELDAALQIGPVVIGVPWFEGMYDAPGGRVVVSGQQVGAHCLLLTGIDVEAREYVWRNSWGPTYGDNGTARIGWDEFEQLRTNGGECCLPIRDAGALSQ